MKIHFGPEQIARFGCYSNADLFIFVAMEEHPNYRLIERAIGYLRENQARQPDLNELASALAMSPFHFQKVFTDWAGVSPKKFLRYLNLNNAKLLMKETFFNVDETADAIGLSAPSRLHDLFVRMEGMSPGKWKNGAKDERIDYSFAQTLYGECIVASTRLGICYLEFFNEERSVKDLINEFPLAEFKETRSDTHQMAVDCINGVSAIKEIKLDVRGTDFQMKVWQALLKIPFGEVSTYSNLAEQIGSPGASRAVGTAVGSNPVAYLIPCHRVIRNSGVIGEYRWGELRKTAILGRELGLHSND